FCCYMCIMIRVATNNATNCYDSIEIPGVYALSYNSLYKRRNFKCAGAPEQLDIFMLNLVFQKCFFCTVHQATSNKVVVATRHYCKSQPCSIQFAFILFHLIPYLHTL